MKKLIDRFIQFTQYIMPKTYVVALIISILTTSTLVVIETQSLFNNHTNLSVSKGQIVVLSGDNVKKSDTKVYSIDSGLKLESYTEKQQKRFVFEIYATEIERAFSLNLNHLALGQFLGRVTVRFGNKVILREIVSKSMKPIFIPLAGIQSDQNSVLSFDLELVPASKSLGVSYKINTEDLLGFVSTKRLSNINRAQTFINEIYPFILSLLSLIFGLVFYFIYRLQPAWKDSLTISGFFWIASLIASLQTTTLFDMIPDETWIRTLLALKVCEAFAILSLALRFARHNKPWISTMNFIVFTSSIFYAIFFPAELLHEHVFRLSKFVIPFFLAVSSILLFYRGYQIDFLATESRRLGLRQDRLFTFGVIFLVTSVVTFFFTANYQLFPYKTQLNQSFYLFLGFFYCQIIYSELKTTNLGSSLRQFNKTHLDEDFGEPTEGWIYMIDLKKSEILFRRGANFGQGGQLVLTCISQIWSLIAQNGGIVMQCEGDSILALFKEQRHKNLKFFFALTESIHQNIESYKSDLLNQSVFIDDEIKLKFRSSLAKGKVQGIIREIDNDSLTDWIEYGNSNPFVECGRLIDADKTSGERFARESTLVISEEIISEQLPTTKSSSFDLFLQPHTTKSGQKINISIYTPKSKSDGDAKLPPNPEPTP